jgi:hypothetical protein
MPKYDEIRVEQNNSMPIFAPNSATTVSLSLLSTTSEIKRYFMAVLELSKSKEEFPVNLDAVYPLVYSQKGHSLRELKSKFIEGVDYYLSQNGKVVTVNNLANGVKYDCYLSLPCMEFFIARKVRPVFDVYREVFHKVNEIAPKVAKSSAADKRKIAMLEKELEQTKEMLKWARWSERREIELKCACFSYLVETKQYDKMVEHREHKAAERMKRELGLI